MRLTLAEVHAQLDRELLPHIEAPVGSFTQDAMEALLIGSRGVELYRAALLIAKASPNAALVLVRSLVELSILGTWLAVNPALHIRMWQAETGRLMLRDAAAFRSYLQSFGDVGEVIEAGIAADMKARIASARATALDAGEPIFQKGRVIPALERMARIDPDLADTYQVLYRQASPWTHSGAWSMGGATFDHQGSWKRLRSGHGWGATGVELTAVPSMIRVVIAVSQVANLGIHSRAEALWDAHNPPRARRAVEYVSADPLRPRADRTG